MTLTVAIERSGLQGLEGDLFLAYMFADHYLEKYPGSVLDREDVASLNMYTKDCEFYRALNRALATKDRTKTKVFFPYLRLALGAMFKCPLVRGTFTRGIKNPNLENYKQGRKPFIWWPFTSTTQSINVTKDFLGQGNRMLFIVEGVGVDISPFSDFPEAEVLLLPGALIQVAGVLSQGNLTITQLKQVAAPPVIDYVHPQLALSLIHI